MEIKGELIEVFETVQVSDKFKKREFVVKYAENPEYPEYIKFQLVQDKCELVDSLTAGSEITVHFNLKGREWTNPKGEKVYFNTLDAWKIESQQQNDAPRDIESDDNADDLPF